MQISVVKDFLKSQNWQFSQIDGKNVILFGINGKNGNFQCIADLIDDEIEKRFVFFSVCGVNAPLEKKNAMLELINALNSKLLFGNFEMDLEEGEIRFKTSISYKNFKLNHEILEEIIMTNIVIMDRSLPAIMGLMFGDISIEKAIELSEKYFLD